MGQRLRGGAFVLCFYALMMAMGAVGAVLVLWRQDWTRAWMKGHNRIAFALLRVLCGLRVEIRGPIPQDRVLVAAKHQSLLDVLILYNALPQARFVMKRELLWTPVFGYYARRSGALPIDRSGGAGEVARMAAAFAGAPGQILIYPQGTRVAPGARAPYRRGAARLYGALELPLVLAATNAGEFWPRRGLAIRPGVAVVEFFDRLPPGLPPAEAASLIESRIEAATDRLSAAGVSRVASPRSGL